MARASFTLAALFVMAAAEPLCGNDDAESFAAVLQRVLRSSRENFRPVEGARIELHPSNRSYFQARISLPGTTDCRIDEPPHLVYSCQWKPSQVKSPSACDKLISDTQAALGAEWLRTDLPAGKTTFRHGGRYRTAEVVVAAPTRDKLTCTIAISISTGVAAGPH